MSNNIQRKVNRTIRLLNRGLSKDIAPYNTYNIRQVKAYLSRETHYENMYIMHLYKDDSLISSKWLDYSDIVGLGNQVVGHKLFWWLNNAIVETKHL
jgi:hypothetical protein